MTPASTTIDLLPWYALAEPYLITIIGSLAGILGTAALGYLSVWLHIKISSVQMNDARNAMQQGAENAAGRVLAQQEGNIASVKFNVHSAEVAAQVPIIMASLKDAAAAVGITPDNAAERVGNLVLGKIGQQQAVATMPVASPPIAPDAPVQPTSATSKFGGVLLGPDAGLALAGTAKTNSVVREPSANDTFGMLIPPLGGNG
jgi:hypothetical protein